VKAFLIFMLALRLLLLTGAAGMCLFGLLAAAESTDPWKWRTGYALGLGLSGFLWLHVWRAAVRTWRE